MGHQYTAQASEKSIFALNNLKYDLPAGLVVSLVALPLCLGIALASGTPLFSGLLSGIIGGIVVGAFSGSHTSVSGPAAGLTAIVASQLASLGSFAAFLLAVFIAGLLQIGLGIMKAGAISAFIPSSVIKGLLTAIGVILVLKQIPHVLGHDTDPEGEMSFQQPDHENTFTEIWNIFQGEIHPGAVVVGLSSIAILVLWEFWKPLKKSIVPGPLVVVLLGVLINELILRKLGDVWSIGKSHLVDIPIAGNAQELVSFLRMPDWSQILNPGVYVAAVTVAIVASLETLLNLEAVDKIDPEQRDSPPSRELIAQGIGNALCGLVGGLPVTSVIVRGSVNLNMNSKTKMSAVFHGVLLLFSVALLPASLNMIPLAALAAILLVTGFKLASPKLFLAMWREGRYQFIPFVLTVLAIIFTDLLIGILIGLAISLLFILNSNLRRPIPRTLEMRGGEEVLHIDLPNQVSFLNRAALDQILEQAQPGTHVLMNASETDYIDPDILSLIREFKETRGPARGVGVSLQGFRNKYEFENDLSFPVYETRASQAQLNSDQVLKILKTGNQRFRAGKQLRRDYARLLNATTRAQSPLVAVLSCIDSRVPVELIFDLAIGDVFSVRVAGNIIGDHTLGSLEYATVVTGVKLIVVMGHTGCGAVRSSLQLVSEQSDRALCPPHLHSIVNEIEHVLPGGSAAYITPPDAQDESFVNEICQQNVIRTIREIEQRSQAIQNAVVSGELQLIGAMYDVVSGEVQFLSRA